MGVVRVEEQYDERSTEVSVDGGRNYTRSWVIICDDAFDGPGEIRKASGLPSIGDPYIDFKTGYVDFGAKCSRINVDLKPGSDRIWVLQALYSTKIGANQKGDNASNDGEVSSNDPVNLLDADRIANTSKGRNPGTIGSTTPPSSDISPSHPVFQPLKIQIDTEELNQVVTWAFNDNDQLVRVQNTAGDPFDPPLEEQFTVLVLTFSRSYFKIFLDKFRIYPNTVNKNPWLGFPARSVLCSKLTASMEYSEGIPYWATTAVFKIRTEGIWSTQVAQWKREILNAGYRHKEVVNNVMTLQTFKDDFGQPLGKGLLDANGFKLPKNANPIYLTYRTKLETDFKGIMGV